MLIIRTARFSTVLCDPTVIADIKSVFVYENCKYPIAILVSDQFRTLEMAKKTIFGMAIKTMCAFDLR